MGFLPDRSEVVMRYVLERHAKNQPTKECMRFEDGRCWSYGDALKQAYRAANYLASKGVERGDHVLIFLPNGPEWLQAWWGINFLGAVMIPVNTAYRGEMLRHICGDSKSKYIITSHEFFDRINELGMDLKPIDAGSLSQGSETAPDLAQPIDPWDIHAIVYTSGTTGLSKGVLQPYLSLYMNGPRYVGMATPADTMLVDLPLFHASGLCIAHAALISGARIALRTVFSGSRYWDIVRETGATLALWAGTIPAYLESSRPRPDDANNPLRIVMSGPMVKDPAAVMERFGIEKMCATFGSTETYMVFAVRGRLTHPKSCGKKRNGIQVRLVDDHDIPVPPGRVGELIIRTDKPWELFSGYWRNPEATARAWRNGWFHTGDTFFCDEEGNYFFVDRKKDAIRRRGENISSMEVEREVMAYPDVLEAACVAVPAEFGEDEVKVFVTVRDGAEFDPADLIKFLIPKMPHFMVPRYIEVVDEFPKTITDRVKKNELRDLGNSDMTWDREVAGIEVKRSL